MSLTMKDVMTANCAIQHAEMLTSNHCAALARELNKLLASAPVPPAGGEVEVFAYYLHPLGDLEHGRFLKREDAKIADPSKSDHHGTIVLVDRAHVARLTAENARLQAEHLESLLKLADRIHEREKERDALRAEVERKQKTIDGMNQMHAESVEYFQSELTKARELLAASAKTLNNEGAFPAVTDIELFLAHQSALAAKDEKDPRCCCPPNGYCGLWAAGPCPVHMGLRSRAAKPCQQPQAHPARCGCEQVKP